MAELPKSAAMAMATEGGDGAKTAREEYLKRYLSCDSGSKGSKKAGIKKRRRKHQQATTSNNKPFRGMKIVEDDAFLAVAPEQSAIPSDEDECDDLRREIELSTKLAESAAAPKFKKGTFQSISTSEVPSSSSTTKSQKRHRHDSDEDESPPDGRHDDGSSSDDDDDDGDDIQEISPPRHRQNRTNESDSMKEARKHHGKDTKSNRKTENSSDSDISVQRKPTRASSMADDRSRRTVPLDSDGDMSPARRRTQNGSSTRQSLGQKHNGSRSAARNRKSGSDTDLSPVRRSTHRKCSSPDFSPMHRRRRHDSGDKEQSHQKRQSAVKKEMESDSDLSPPRRPSSSKRKDSTDSSHDLSPPRRARQRDSDEDIARARRNHSPSTNERYRSSKREQDRKHHKRERSSSERDDHKKPAQTLDGKKAGLQSAAEVRAEMERLKERENKEFGTLDAEISGRNAETIHRRSKLTSKKRVETTEEKERKEREAKKQEELVERYKLWNKGVKQLQQRGEQLDEMARVASEDFTRHADNPAMNEYMKEVLLRDDPMLEYVKKKKQKSELKAGTVVYPTYKGAWPPNRFSIAPGYRWDGVDRSNGFEARIASVTNRKVAQQKEYYENLSKYE